MTTNIISDVRKKETNYTAISKLLRKITPRNKPRGEFKHMSPISYDSIFKILDKRARPYQRLTL